MPATTDDAYVRLTQTAMRGMGLYTGPVDGDPQGGTQTAFKKLLALASGDPELPPEGVTIDVKPVWVAGAAKRLEDTDLPRIGARIGVGEDEVHAVMDVEAAGSGFDSQDRVKALFEPHIFHRELSKWPDLQKRAVAEGLAYPKWKRSYPKDSYPRFWAAYAIHPEAAMRSTSWGLGQIMGFNYALAGYGSVQKMIEAFADDEDAHLEAMIQFIITVGLADEIRDHDWRGFARGYNGASYAQNNYHTKLESRYAHWRTIRDTPWKNGEQ